jgi:hypothetical protein
MAKTVKSPSGKTASSTASQVREATRIPVTQSAQPHSTVRTKTTHDCEDCRAMTAFQAWHSLTMTPSFNWLVSFEDWNLIPKGKRAIIELVTAQIIVPAGEWVRLRMYTSLGTVPSNLDLFVTFQGNVGGNAVYVATHSLRAYSDADIDFDISRDNGTTQGSALICVSGYIAG